MKKKTCFKCAKKIDDNENYINLLSYNKGKVIEDVSFHILCWGKFNQEKVDERIRQIAGMGMDMIKNLGIPIPQ